MENIQQENLLQENPVEKNIQDRIIEAKEALPNITPTPPPFKPESSVHDLKSRLEWGEPALTILDVRDHESFMKGHIRGAMSAPIEQLADIAQSLNKVRDIYIYSATEAESLEAVTQLEAAGFQNVARLGGGLEAWKAIEGSTEGTEEIDPPGADAYNVVSRLAHHQQAQRR